MIFFHFFYFAVPLQQAGLWPSDPRRDILLAVGMCIINYEMQSHGNDFILFVSRHLVIMCGTNTGYLLAFRVR